MELSAFRELIETLESMLHIYKALGVIALEKKDHIIQNRVTELTSCTAKETKLLKEISELDAAVRSASIRLQRDLGFRPKIKMTLTELGKLVFQADEKQELAALQTELAEAADRLRKANELNQQLLQQSIEFVSFSLDVMYGAPDEEVVYKKPTLQPQGQKRNGLFDTRA